jgi:lysine 2,3-aminomutase
MARQTLRHAHALAAAGLIPHDAIAGVARVEQRYAVAIPPAMQALIERPDDPIGLQFIPDLGELVTAPHERTDPIADDALAPIKGVVHRYPDRALLKPLLICPVYCRFCFRREHVGPDGGLLTEAELQAAYDWFAAHPAIREVILTGGDPLMLSPGNHAREFTPASLVAIRRIQSRAIPMLGQSVLLRGVNDDAETLEALFRAMLGARVKPYYLHQLDPAPGTARFHVPIEEGRRLLARLRGRVTGLAWPTYVLDIPGGHGKVPIGPDYLEPDDRVRDPDGIVHER